MPKAVRGVSWSEPARNAASKHPKSEADYEGWQRRLAPIRSRSIPVGGRRLGEAASLVGPASPGNTARRRRSRQATCVLTCETEGRARGCRAQARQKSSARVGKAHDSHERWLSPFKCRLQRSQQNVADDVATTKVTPRIVAAFESFTPIALLRVDPLMLYLGRRAGGATIAQVTRTGQDHAEPKLLTTSSEMNSGSRGK